LVIIYLWADCSQEGDEQPDYMLRKSLTPSIFTKKELWKE